MQYMHICMALSIVQTVASYKLLRGKIYLKKILLFLSLHFDFIVDCYLLHPLITSKTRWIGTVENGVHGKTGKKAPIRWINRKVGARWKQLSNKVKRIWIGTISNKVLFRYFRCFMTRGRMIFMLEIHSILCMQNREWEQKKQGEKTHFSIMKNFKWNRIFIC